MQIVFLDLVSENPIFVLMQSFFEIDGYCIIYPRSKIMDIKDKYKYFNTDSRTKKYIP